MALPLWCSCWTRPGVIKTTKPTELWTEVDRVTFLVFEPWCVSEVDASSEAPLASQRLTTQWSGRVVLKRKRPLYPFMNSVDHSAFGVGFKPTGTVQERVNWQLETVSLTCSISRSSLYGTRLLLLRKKKGLLVYSSPVNSQACPKAICLLSLSFFPWIVSTLVKPATGTLSPSEPAPGKKVLSIFRDIRWAGERELASKHSLSFVTQVSYPYPNRRRFSLLTTHSSHPARKEGSPPVLLRSGLVTDITYRRWGTTLLWY